MKAVVTGVDVYRWYPSGTPGEGPVEEAVLGDEIDVSEAEFERVEGALSKPADAKAGYPKKNGELDALALDNDFAWPEGTKSIADKQAALLAAGVEPPPPDEE